jgi:hypothetical protein
VPGAEKKIIWAGEAAQKTPLSIVYLHGFSATRQERAPQSAVGSPPMRYMPVIGQSATPPMPSYP